MNADNLRTLEFRGDGQTCDYRATAPAARPGAFDHFVGKVNTASFLDRPAGSVLFRGYGMYAHDLATEQDIWEFHFIYSPRPWDREAADFATLAAHLEGQTTTSADPTGSARSLS